VSSLPDLGGRWLGLAQDKKLHVASVQDYDFVARAASPGAFDIYDITTDGVVGNAIATSCNQIRAHVIVGGRNSSLTGKFNSARRMLALKGFDVARHRITIQVTQQ
jgi:hypothetical protein